MAYTMLGRSEYDGLGIVIDGRSGIVGYDADSCISDGAISPQAFEHIKILDTYTEESFSGAGIHCVAYGALPPQGRKRGRFEMYGDKRFFVVTGRHLRGTSNRIEHRQSEINVVHAAIFGEQRVRQSVTQFRANTQGYGKSEGGVVGSGSGSELRSDQQVLRLLRRDPKAWRYFSVGAGQKNPSRADFALGCKLAFYTGRCLEQMYRLFMWSAHVARPKCSTTRRKVDYVEYTLRRCLKQQQAFWRPFTRARRSTTPVGRLLSANTKRILRARRRHPTMRPCQIARTLDLPPATVRKVLSRHQSERVGSHEGKQRSEACIRRY
jgi:primase-polymerase (primpol)-like protein